VVVSWREVYVYFFDKNKENKLEERKNLKKEFKHE